MPAPRDNISIVQRPSWSVNPTVIGGGGVPSNAAVRPPTTTPNTRESTTVSSSMPPSTAGDRSRWARTSRAMSQAPAPTRQTMKRRGPHAPASQTNTDSRMTSAPLRTPMPPGPAGMGVRNGADVILESVFVWLAGAWGPRLFMVCLVGAGAWLIARDVRAHRDLSPAVLGGMLLET